MKVKVEYEIYIVTDSHGNSCSAVANESGDKIALWSLKKTNGEPVYFESEAYHLANFCEEHGLKYFCFKRTETLSI
jgi:hypothetical protein